jgi:hypothetical protein
VVREGWGQGGEMNQALYAHMNNKRKMKKKKNVSFGYPVLAYVGNVFPGAMDKVEKKDSEQHMNFCGYNNIVININSLLHIIILISI